MAPRSSLITFLNRNACFSRGKDVADGPVLTHTLMDGASGGKIALREGLEDAFFAAYGEDLAAGHKLFVIERRSETFRMHLDCDFKTMPSEQGLRAFSACVSQAVAAYFGGPGAPEARCVVCCVLAVDGSRKAPGVHLMFPFARVHEKAALWIRAGVVHSLSGLEGFDEDWVTVIDICVLTTSGLRMVGSDKCRTCPECKNAADSRLFCLVCARVGKIPEDKVYWPYAVQPEQDPQMLQCLQEARSNNAHAARLCSTRLPQSAVLSPNFLIPTGAPPCTSKKAVKRGDLDRQFSLCDGGPELQKPRGSQLLTLDAKTIELLTKALRNYHHGFEKTDVKEVREWKHSKGVSLFVKVAGHGTRYCLNKGADHTSQGIYFVVTPLSGLAQKCFCRKDVLRKDGLCADFTSLSKPLPPALKAALFPSEALSSAKVPQQPKRNSSEMQKSAARSADVISALPERLVRARSSVQLEVLYSMEVPSLCG
jgi:hypothetical protein